MAINRHQFQVYILVVLAMIALFMQVAFGADEGWILNDVNGEEVYISSNGYVGIGMKTPDVNLHVDGDIKADNITTDNITAIQVSTGVRRFYSRTEVLGEPDHWDYGIGTLVTDSTWYDLDISTIVPAGAKEVLLFFYAQDDVINRWVEVRRNGNVGVYDIGGFFTQVANQSRYVEVLVTCDADRIIEYRAQNATWTLLNVVVKGWWK